MANFKILESNGVEIENIDGLQFNNFVSGNKDCRVKGVLNECNVQMAGNTLILDTGLLIVKGVRIKITSPIYFTLTGIPSVATNYHLVATLKIQEDRNLTVEIKPRIFTPLIQDDIVKQEYGTYESEIVTFIHNTDGNIGFLKYQIELLSAVYSKIDIDDKLDKNSVNPIQNKVVAQSFEDVERSLKNYANNLVKDASPFYLHNIFVHYNDNATIKYIYVKALSSSATPCETFERLTQIVPKMVTSRFTKEEWDESEMAYVTKQFGQVDDINVGKNGLTFYVYTAEQSTSLTLTKEEGESTNTTFTDNVTKI